MTSLMLYVRYEYIETGCFNLKCYLSQNTISDTKLVKLDIVITLILITGSLHHFSRIYIRAYYHKWYEFHQNLLQSRFNYPREVARLLKSGFGKAHVFEMKRAGLNKGEYLMVNLETLE